MKKLLVLVGVVLVAVFTLSLISSAHPGGGWGRGGGWSRGAGRGPGSCFGGGPVHFDASALKTLTGKVVSYETVGGFGPMQMKTLKLESEGKITTIALGPEFYLTAEKLTLQKGDTVTVVASPAVNRTDISHIAKSVTVNGETTTLRDEAGFPVWRGSGRGFSGYGRGGMRGGPGRGRGFGPGMMGPGGGYGPAYMIPSGQ